MPRERDNAQERRVGRKISSTKMMYVYQLLYWNNHDSVKQINNICGEGWGIYSRDNVVVLEWSHVENKQRLLPSCLS